MRRNTSLSDHWRVNRSSVEHIELVRALKAVRKFLGCLDFDIEVIWSGMIFSPGKYKIELPPSLVLGEYPIPARKMDVLLGYAVHEAFHLIENSRYVREYMYRRYSDDEERSMVLSLAETGEDIHVDGVARKRGMSGRYAQRFRAWWQENERVDIPKSFPSLEGLLDNYLGIMLDVIYPNTDPADLDALKPFSNGRKIDTEKLAGICCVDDRTLMLGFNWVFMNTVREAEEPLKALITRTGEIVEKDQRARAVLYGDFWAKWGGRFIRWKREAEKRTKHELRSDKDKFESKSMDSDLAGRVRTALDHDARDMDCMLGDSLELQGRGALKRLLLPMVHHHATDPCNTPPDSILADRIRSIVNRQQQNKAKITRGLMSGKIDSARLYRVSTTGLIFKDKEYSKENSWNVAVLVDASGSMRSNWSLVKRIYSTFAEAWREDKNRLQLFAYNASGSNCKITNLFYGGRLFATDPGGNTPSSQAVIAAAILMQEGSRRFILHITDGQMNVGVEMDIALTFCEERGIDLVTIGTTGIDILALRDRYGSNRFVVIELIQDLSNALEDSLKMGLLGNNIQNSNGRL